METASPYHIYRHRSDAASTVQLASCFAAANAANRLNVPIYAAPVY